VAKVNRKVRVFNKVPENRKSGLYKRFSIFKAEGGDFGINRRLKVGMPESGLCFPASIGE